jgi:alpha-galactosidase
VIAVDQDSLGIQGRKVRDDGDFEVWSKPLRDGSRAVVLFNRSSGDTEISVSWQEIELSVEQAAVRDLWEKKDLGRFQNSYSVLVPSHGCVMVKITP